MCDGSDKSVSLPQFIVVCGVLVLLAYTWYDVNRIAATLERIEKILTEKK